MTTGMPRVMVVLLNWRNSADTIACLAQLTRATYANLACVVVDNGSADASAERIRRAAPGVPLIESPTNRGFAGGMNLGLRYALAAGADYALVLNADTVVPPDMIARLVDTAEQSPQTGVVGPKLYRAGKPGTFSMYGFRLTRAGIRVVGWNAVDHGQFDNAPIDAITGCAMLIPASTLRAVGLFDERFFFSYEDIDYCLRVHDAGLSVRIAPEASLEHELGGATRGRRALRQRLVATTRGQFYHKHWRRFSPLSLPVGELRETANQVFDMLRSRDIGAAWSYLTGLAAGFRGQQARTP